ncbi:MAG: alpha-1,2-fucosyltransferase [Eubacteriales bacterium]|nr:alpha-1,2-fucosyltransferase [Eubacteriales bacterium]
MVAVQLSGGLGNQMFEYALYLKLKSMGKKVKIDDFTCYGPSERQRSNQLGVFGVSYDRLSQREYEALTDSCMLPWHRARRLLFGRKDRSYREADCNFDPELLRREQALLLGYFQTEKYFADIREQVREAFTFRNLTLSGTSGEYLRQIESCRAVSVHVRRGDYLKLENQKIFGGICDETYYERALQFVRSKYEDAVFFFFSNDPEWVKARYGGPGCVVAEGNGEDGGCRDLFLMSRCRHHILANSSFSWWGAWLDSRLDKTVIAPKRWFNDRDCRDIYTEQMTVL